MVNIPIVEFVVEWGRARRTASGKVLADVHLKVDGIAFPAEVWPDFVADVIAAFAEATALLTRGEVTTRTIRFMEGPYSVEISRARGVFELRCIQIRADGSRSIVRQTTTEIGQFAEELLSTSRSILAACAKRSLRKADLTVLKNAISDLERALTGHLA